MPAVIGWHDKNMILILFFFSHFFFAEAFFLLLASFLNDCRCNISSSLVTIAYHLYFVTIGIIVFLE